MLRAAARPSLPQKAPFHRAAARPPQAGLLGSMRYISSCSGASWFNAPFSFANVSVPAFLGPYLPPESLTLAALGREAPGSFGRVTSQASFIRSGAVVGPCEREWGLTAACV